MQKTQLLDILDKIGLSKNEASVYLAALSLGSATIQKIAHEADVKRTTTYSVIDSLKAKGLMKIEQKGLKQFFVPENPEKLESILDERKKKLIEALPEFSALFNLRENESLVQYHEGLESVKTIYNDNLRDIQPHESYLVISDMEEWYNKDPDFFQDFIERRAKLNIDIRLLLTDSPIARKQKRFEKNYNERVKILPKNTKLTTNLIVTPQRASIQLLVPPVFAIVTKNRNTIKMYQEMFEVMWNALPDDN